MSYLEIEHIFPKTGLKISLGPGELNELEHTDYLETAAASVKIVDYNCKPYARVISFRYGYQEGMFFAICLPAGTKVPFPDPGQESLMAIIPDRRIKPRDPNAKKVYNEVIGGELGGLALIAHGAFNDTEASGGNT
jgi:hypothetical protein